MFKKILFSTKSQSFVSPEYYYAVGDEDEKADRIAERHILITQVAQKLC
jgi:hypothetical protein